MINRTNTIAKLKKVNKKMSDQFRSFGINSTKSVIAASSSFYHTTSAGHKNNEQEEDFIPLVIVPVIIVVGICCTMLCLLKKYKICRRGQVVHHEVFEGPHTEITNDQGPNTNSCGKDNDKEEISRV